MADASVPDFVGSEACAGCHAEIYEDWRPSQHARAMQHATADTVLGDFADKAFEYAGVKSTFFERDDKFFVNTDSRDGTLADFEILYAFGVYPLQQYLVGMPGGRLQALGIAWDSRPQAKGGQRWFHLYPDQKVTAGHRLHWTSIDQNWNYQCAFCHSTNLKKHYDPTRDEFKTTWSEISVGCEACHGPGSTHVAWASAGSVGSSPKAPNGMFMVRFDERNGVRWSQSEHGTSMRSTPRITSKEIETCAQCHARRQQFSDDASALAEGLHQAFRPALLEEPLYYPDGQQRDEVYTYGSFLQSRMYASGVTCSDCHDPHTQTLRATGNSVCAQCHEPRKFDVTAHHHHAEGSPGSACAACHMPTATYMVVDPRHDHSFRIPRPEVSQLTGAPNACIACHGDRTNRWAGDVLKSWHPAQKARSPDFALAFHLADTRAPGAQSELMRLITDRSQAEIVRASAVRRMGRFLSRRSLPIVAEALGDSQPSVQVAAIEALSTIDPQARYSLLAPLLEDETALVRMEAARALAGTAEPLLDQQEARAFRSALDEYFLAQSFNAERPETQANLAGLFRERGRLDAAELALEQAIRIDAGFAPAYVLLADIYRSLGEESKAEATLRKALEYNASSAEIVHSLGLSLVRQRRMDEALEMLAKSTELDPTSARFAYVAGVALHDSGRSKEALAMLQGAIAQDPYDRDLLQALAIYESESGLGSTALARAELLSELEPDNPEFQQLLAAIRQQLKSNSEGSQ